MFQSAAAADMQTIAAALIALIDLLPSCVERVQLYRAVQDVTIATKNTLTRNKGLRANIKAVSNHYKEQTPLVRKAKITRPAFRCPFLLMSPGTLKALPMSARSVSSSAAPARRSYQARATFHRRA